MLINIQKSKLFTTDPAQRFAREYGVPPALWTDLWRRYKLLDYRVPELCEFFRIKAGAEIDRRMMYKWVFRAEIYSKARPIVLKGVKVVSSEYFGEHEDEIVSEVLRHLKNGETKNSRIMA